MALTLIKDDEFLRIYKLKDNREISINISDMLDEISVKDTQGKVIGRIELCEQSDYGPSVYKITWMYMDLLDSSYKKMGIGRQCLLFFKEITDSPIVVSENDGMRRGDGSHLTGDAPAFVAQMQNEGIIENSDDADFYEEY